MNLKETRIVYYKESSPTEQSSDSFRFLLNDVKKSGKKPARIELRIQKESGFLLLNTALVA